MVSPVLLPAPDGKNRQVQVPILMYHYISDPPTGADEVRRDLSLPGPDFELQLRYLVNEGYQSVTMQDLVTHIQRGTPLPEKPIVLTFDDGYKDAFTVALPLLKKYGFTGTFFIFTKPIDEENREYLTWQEVELMSSAGMEIGSHSYSHPDLRKLSDEALATEIVDSKKEIEAHTQKPVLFFCYPSGAHDARVVQAVDDAGYWAAVTTQQGDVHSGDSRLTLDRVRVRGEAGLERFEALLGWEW
jgi:peptidoglycan/xylan/chitin deacetylase (PgdA/CDA1 family)